MPEPVHVPVMVREVLEGLRLRAGGVYVDGTLGLGGHARAILEDGPGVGRVIGMDWDQDALALAQKRLLAHADRILIVHGNYRDIPDLLLEQGIDGVDGIVLDLGLSSFQLEAGERGFSFLREELLDMRMDRFESVTAADLVNELPKDQIEEIIRTYGEERWARRIAGAIVRRREIQPIFTSADLARVVSHAIPARFHSRHIHPATRTFQALRIAVNRELENLRDALDTLPSCLVPGGRLCIITFHSLEDRLVKDAFRSDIRLMPVTKRPIIPGEDEIAANPRARSAKLRIAERIHPKPIPQGETP
ncbi:MAG: 16S rRNA (cytosine(1402)-N(4))-methyltransferase RsmH [Deltaproteobacteria bacterium]